MFYTDYLKQQVIVLSSFNIGFEFVAAFRKLYTNPVLLLADSSGESTLWLLKRNQAFQTVIQLRNDELDEVLGEAVISESESEIRLHGVFVKSNYQGRGYGTALMKAVLSLGAAKLMTLCTGLGNVAFFERFGFEITEIGESLVHMQKPQ